MRDLRIVNDGHSWQETLWFAESQCCDSIVSRHETCRFRPVVSCHECSFTRAKVSGIMVFTGMKECSSSSHWLVTYLSVYNQCYYFQDLTAMKIQGRKLITIKWYLKHGYALCSHLNYYKKQKQHMQSTFNNPVGHFCERANVHWMWVGREWVAVL